MKVSHALVTLTLLTSVASFPAWAESTHPAGRAAASEKTTGAQVRQEVGEAVDSIKSYSADKRDEAMKKAEAALNDFDARMEKLEQRAKEKKDMAFKELKEERKEVAKRYEDMKRSSKETWEEAKTAFLNSYHELERRFKKADEETPAQ